MLNIHKRLERLWAKVPETRIASDTDGTVIEYNDGCWFACENQPDADVVTIPETMLQDLACGPIERWLRTKMLRLDMCDHYTGFSVETYEPHHGRFNAQTKIEALLAAAEKVAGIET